MKDTIYRQDAIDAVLSVIPYDEYWEEQIKKAVNSLPPAPPKRYKGKWNTYVRGYNNFTYSCNICGYSAPYQIIDSKTIQKKWIFCPNCGAYMIE